jgi:hypothetical protein
MRKNMTLIRFFVKVLFIMFVLPALGLIVFHGGFGYGLLTALLTSVVGLVVAIFLMPLLFTGGLAALLAGSLLGGAIGARLASFAIETGLYAVTLAIIAAILSGVTLLGFWPTVGAAAILALVSNVLTSHSSN